MRFYVGPKKFFILGKVGQDKMYGHFKPVSINILPT